MIDINYNDPTDVVRSNIGDPNTEYVTDTTITSALVKCDGDEIKASILLMETLLSYFLTQAELERTAQVEYEYKKIYERYKSRLQDFQNKHYSKYTTGIIIGGTSLNEVNRVNSNDDSFTMWINDTYQELMMEDRVVREHDFLESKTED